MELDHRYNPGEASGDLVYDHVGIHTSGRGSNNSALATSELVPPRAWDLADGQHHLVKVILHTYSLQGLLFKAVSEMVRWLVGYKSPTSY